MLDLWAVISYVWYIYWRLAPGEWLIAIGCGWWGLIKSDRDPGAAHVWWAVALVVLGLGMLAKAMDYVVFRKTDWRGQGVAGRKSVSATGVAAGAFVRYSDPVLRLHYRTFRVKVPVRVQWFSGDRPPVLGLLSPQSIDLGRRDFADHLSCWSYWYPGSRVTCGTVYIAGVGRPGLELSFVGRRVVIGFDEDEDAAATETVLVENA